MQRTPEQFFSYAYYTELPLRYATLKQQKIFRSVIITAQL